MGKILDQAQCYQCKGKIDVNKLIRAPVKAGHNANFYSKKCYKKYCSTDKELTNQYKQRCGNK